MREVASGDIVEQANAAIGAGDPYRARQLVEQYLAGLAADAPTSAWVPAIEAIVALAVRWEDDILIAAGRRALADSDDADALYDLGHRLIDMDVLAMAGPILARAVHVEPTSKTVCELVAVLELQGRYGDAADVIESSGLADSDPVCSYLLAFEHAMGRDLGPARDRLPELERLEGEPFRTLAARLGGMVERADALGKRLVPDDLRAWHFVWTGGVLLAPDTSSPRRGLASWSETRGSLDALIQTLEQLNLEFSKVMTPPDRGSGILGLAVGTLLGLPVVTWRGEKEAGLLVVFSQLELDQVLRSALRPRPPGQALYVHVADATREQPAAGEFTGYFGSGFRAPWQGGIDDDDEFVEPDEGAPDELAPRVANAALPTNDSPDRRGFLDLVASTGLVDNAVRHGGERSRQWVLPEPFRTP